MTYAIARLGLLAILAGLAVAPTMAQDATAGQAVFGKCAGCHDVGADPHNRMGPVLSGVVGRVAGTYEGYKYSKVIVDAGAGGLTWTPETLDAFLADPHDYLKGIKMPNIAVKDATDRANLIAYLQSVSPAAAPAVQ